MNGTDDGRVIPAELGPKVAAKVRLFEDTYRGGCGHEADQWAAVGSVRSACLGCLRVAGPAALWEHGGVCDVCGRAMAAALMTWAVGTSVGAVAVVRLCGECREGQVLALGESEAKGDDAMAGAVRLPFMAWLSITAGATPPTEFDEWTIKHTRCCKACATGWIDAAEGRQSGLKLHADCRQAIGHVAAASRARSVRRGPWGQSRRDRIAAARGVLALAGAEVVA